MLLAHKLLLHVGYRYPVTGDVSRFTWATKETPETPDADAVLVDLTGYTSTLTVYPYTAAPTTLLVLTDASGITMGGTLGYMDLVFTLAQVNALGAGSYPYIWQLTPTIGDAFIFSQDWVEVMA